MQYLILLSAVMSLATAVMAQEREPAINESSEAMTLEGKAGSEPVSAAAVDFNELEEFEV